MTLQQIYTKEHGEKGWKKLAPRLKKLFLRIDDHPLNKKGFTSKEVREALK